MPQISFSSLIRFKKDGKMYLLRRIAQKSRQRARVELQYLPSMRGEILSMSGILKTRAVALSR